MTGLTRAKTDPPDRAIRDDWRCAKASPYPTLQRPRMARFERFPLSLTTPTASFDGEQSRGVRNCHVFIPRMKTPRLANASTALR